MIRIHITRKEVPPVSEAETPETTESFAKEECKCKRCLSPEDKEFDPATATADELRKFGERSKERTEAIAEVLNLSILCQEAGFEIQSNIGDVETVVIPKLVAEDLVEILDLFEATISKAIDTVAEKREKETQE